MIIRINEDEVQEAIMEYLHKKHNIKGSVDCFGVRIDETSEHSFETNFEGNNIKTYPEFEIEIGIGEEHNDD